MCVINPSFHQVPPQKSQKSTCFSSTASGRSLCACRGLEASPKTHQAARGEPKNGRCLKCFLDRSVLFGILESDGILYIKCISMNHYESMYTC